jgi:caffeoyl-CoA O-methyltransferase
MPSLLPIALDQYIEAHTSDEGTVLQALDRLTHRDVLMPQMLSGKVQGRFLSIISRLMKPHRILEIGTFTGYSAICLAEGLPEDGHLFTIDINEELENTVTSHIAQAGLQEKITLLVGNAADIIPGLEETFDLVFIDADKINYGLYFDLVIGKVRPGGLIMADNVLWSGKIIGEAKDKDTQALRAFNQKIQEDSRVDNVIVSIRDGITLMYKK